MLQSVTPSPLNLIPTPFGISNFLLLMNGGKISESEKKLCDEVDSKTEDLEYPALMTHLVQRYFREKDSAVATASEMDIFRQEIHELKVLLNNIIEGS
ncbi:unnamed protein product [Acanthoscelides obtectus]|nr:unnamed protein product [Acanthoscelides obtectus]CAK1670526.1 hypothetical protein AOBTE_LOCUS27654 [Acanthoscelides obtectus]